MWLGIGSMFSLLPFLVFWSALQQQQDGTRYAYRPQTYKNAISRISMWSYYEAPDLSEPLDLPHRLLTCPGWGTLRVKGLSDGLVCGPSLSLNHEM